MRNTKNQAALPRFRPVLGVLLASTLAVACGGGGGGGDSGDPGSGGGGGGGGTVGSTVLNPSTGLNYVVDQHQGGSANSLRIQGLFWGRLVDIQDSTGELLFRDFVIGEKIQSNGVDFKLERNPVTARETLTILYPFDSPQFRSAFSQLETNVTNVLDKGLGANVLPPFTMVARNSALVLRLNDLLKDGGNPTDPGYPGTVNPGSVQLMVGYPPTTAFDARILPDPNHGDMVNGQFHSTRVIMDLTVSRLEAQQTGLPVNSLGLPGAIVATQPNFVIRMPTLPNAGQAQFQLLENLSGSRLSFNGNGSNDPFSATLDVVRAARSGGSQVGDPNNGFLDDKIKPEILGAQAISLTLTSSTGPEEYIGTIAFGTKQCASRPRAGDVLEFTTHSLIVTQPGNKPINGSVTGVALQLLVGDAASFQPPLTVVGQYRTTWDPNAGAAPECFVRFSPAAKTPPNAGVSVQSDVIVSFSEPMDPASVLPFQSYQIEYGQSPVPSNPMFRRVVGTIVPSTNLADFTFEPTHQLKHHGDPTMPVEQYLVSVANGSSGVTDLAGNALLNALPQVDFSIDSKEPKVDSGGITFDFSTQNEDGDTNSPPWPEIRGQFLQDVTAGRVSPRAVTRFSAALDDTQAFVGSMIPISAPIQTPLSNHGSKMHTIWRYVDMGFSLLDDNNHNLDVEGLWWEPYAGTPQFDIFPEFEMRLGHCFYAPDEDVDDGLLPKFTGSGLANKYDQNYASLTEDPPVIVHAKSEGYLIQPVNTVSETGRNIAAWPMNREKPQSEFVYWTWRDTSKLMLGGPSGVGVDPSRATAVLSGAASYQGLYPKDEVPSIGMPLLMEFRTYANNASSGQNGFHIAIAINSSANPYFRTFSTGGVLNSGQVVTVLPDQENTGTGGVNPVGGGKTPSRDNSFYYGQADFVVRVSRFHTIWLDTQVAGSAFATPVTEPSQSQLPSGTQVALAFRGASAVQPTATTTSVTPWLNAGWYDPYGDPFDNNQWKKLSGGSVTFPDNSFKVTEFPVNGDETWTSNPLTLSGARYIQVRVTMISNPLNGLSPYLSALGLSYKR